MKKLLSLIVLSCFVFASCSSDGDRGPQGPPGEDGVSILGQAFEVEGVEFTDPNYSIFAEIPGNIEVLDTDAILVYWLEDVDEGSDVWSLLPQTFYFDDGQFQYNYNHTDFDVNIYLQGNIDLSTLGSEFTQDQVFKIVVLPIDYAASVNANLLTYEQLKQTIEIEEMNVKAKVQ